MKDRVRRLEEEIAGLPPAAPVEKRIDLLNELAWEYGFDEIERARQLTEEASRLAHQHQYKRGLARS